MVGEPQALPESPLKIDDFLLQNASARPNGLPGRFSGSALHGHRAPVLPGAMVSEGHGHDTGKKHDRAAGIRDGGSGLDGGIRDNGQILRGWSACRVSGMRGQKRDGAAGDPVNDRTAFHLLRYQIICPFCQVGSILASFICANSCLMAVADVLTDRLGVS